jgi:hypothetical protein
MPTRKGGLASVVVGSMMIGFAAAVPLLMYAIQYANSEELMNVQFPPDLVGQLIVLALVGVVILAWGIHEVMTSR